MSTPQVLPTKYLALLDFLGNLVDGMPLNQPKSINPIFFGPVLFHFRFLGIPSRTQNMIRGPVNPELIMEAMHPESKVFFSGIVPIPSVPQLQKVVTISKPS